MKILVVDDHGLFRAGLRLLVVSVRQEAEVFEAATLPEAIAAAQRIPDLDLCLLDLGLDGVQGIDTLTAFKSAVPDVAVVVVSAACDAMTIQRCLDAGAMSFVPKAMSPDTLTLAVQQVLAGYVYLPPEAMHIAPPVPAAPSLSPRQLDVLRGLARGLPTKSIARELHLSEHTAKEYIASVFQALGVHNRTHAVIIGTRLGLSGAMPAEAG